MPSNVATATPTDEVLLQRYLAGDQSAFTAIHDRLSAEIVNYIATRYFSGDRMHAEDATQMAFLKLAEEAAYLDLSKPIRPWLFFVASNVAVDAQRASVRRPAVSLSYMMEAGRSESFDPEDVETEAPLEGIVAEEVRAELRQVIDQLPDDDRAAVEAVYLQGRSFNDAAEHINIPVGSLKTRVHRALKFLRVRLDTADRKVA